MKKELNVLFILFLLLTVAIPTFVSSQVSNAITDTTDKITVGVNGATSKWDYLRTEWKTIFLKNSIVATINGFLKTISPVFVILFAMPYEMSLVLLCVIILWIVFCNACHNLLKSSGIVDKNSSLVLSLLLTIGLAQLGIFKGIVIFTGGLAFSPESKLARAILVVGIIIILFLFQYITNFFSKYMKLKREANARDLEKLNRTIFGKFVSNFMEFSSIGK